MKQTPAGETRYRYDSLYQLTEAVYPQGRRGQFTYDRAGDGLNLYAYCHNNPVGYVDPSGHDACPIAEQKYKDQGYSDKEANIKATYDAMMDEQGARAAKDYLDRQIADLKT